MRVKSIGSSTRKVYRNSARADDSDQAADTATSYAVRVSTSA